MPASLARRFFVSAVVLASVLSAACSDGAAGDNGVVRFSFVGHYVEGADKDTPVATNSTLRIALQHPKPTILDSDASTFVQLHLQVEAIQDGDDAQVFPTGIAEFGVFFTKAGTYRLTALQGDKPLDTLTLTVADPDALTFSGLSVITDAACPPGQHRADEPAPDLAHLDLAANQTAVMFVVPRAKGKALMGLPALVADGPNGSLDTVPSSYALTALGLSITPDSPGKNIDLTVTDLGNSLTAKATIKTHSGNATPHCE